MLKYSINISLQPQTSLSADKPMPGYLSYQNKGKKQFKIMLDWKDHSCCSSLKAIRRAAQTQVEIKEPFVS